MLLHDVDLNVADSKGFSWWIFSREKKKGIRGM